MKFRILTLFAVVVACSINVLSQKKTVPEVDMSSLPYMEDALKDVCHMSDSLKYSPAIYYTITLKKKDNDIYLDITYNPKEQPYRAYDVGMLKAYCKVGSRIFLIYKDDVGLKTLKKWKTFREMDSDMVDRLQMGTGISLYRWYYLITNKRSLKRILFKNKWTEYDQLNINNI